MFYSYEKKKTDAKENSEILFDMVGNMSQPYTLL